MIAIKLVDKDIIFFINKKHLPKIIVVFYYILRLTY